MKQDKELELAIEIELEWEPSIHAKDIDVHVDKGVATLTGEVPSYFEQSAIDQVVRRIHGVKHLHDKTRVKLHETHQRADNDIATAVQHVLDWTTSLSTESITSSVSDGWVTLSGHVNWQFQRVAVADAVSHLKGVIGVRDEITINPAVSRDVVQADIEAALKRSSSSLDKDNVSVGVSGAQVTLRGSVGSWAEHVAATRAAWNAPGVIDVVDEITLEY